MAANNALFLQHDIDQCVKCVVVGDTGVGKTCLTCARACGTRYSLKQLVKTHVSTVWAIDHYHADPEILSKSWCEVDSVRVSLRLWDTFGYHDKNRSFAYGRADVVLLCFSVVNSLSLSNVRRHWIPEITHYCPNVPVVMVGTQADMRYMYDDPQYQRINKGLLYRCVTKNDIVTPAQGRDVAQSIGAPYYETSVLTEFGITDVFDNVIRAALRDRLKIRFWNSILRNMGRPKIQEPMAIPKPRHPDVTVPPSTLHHDLHQLLLDRKECDVIFRVNNLSIHAHKIVLAVSSDVFYNLFTIDMFDSVLSPSSTLSAAQSTKTSQTNVSIDSYEQDQFVYDNDVLTHDEIHIHSTNHDHDVGIISTHQDVDIMYVDTTSDPPQPRLLPRYELNHAAFRSISTKLVDNLTGCREITIVDVDQSITVAVFDVILEYLYTGCIQTWPESIINDVIKAAELMRLSDLVDYLSPLSNKGTQISHEFHQRAFMERRAHMLRQKALDKGIFADVCFEVDDGSVPAHKALLVGRCDVMAAMFSGAFLESSSRQIQYPGVTTDTLRVLLDFLYTDHLPCMQGVDCMALIEVSNRLWLPRLVALTEQHMISELTQHQSDGDSVLEDVLYMVDLARLMNANQLSAWCLYQLSTHFVDVIKKHTKQWKALPRDIQVLIDKHRWPPTWYLKERELYEKLREESIHKNFRQSMKRQRAYVGCLCFGLRSRVKVHKSSPE